MKNKTAVFINDLFYLVLWIWIAGLSFALARVKDHIKRQREGLRELATHHIAWKGCTLFKHPGHRTLKEI